MELVLHFLMRLLMRWLVAHQDTWWGRFLLKQRGPRQDVTRMTRRQRLRSARSFLLFGVVSGALFAVSGYLSAKLGLDRHEAIYMCIIWFLGIFTLMGLGGGIYLFAHVLIGTIADGLRWRFVKPPMATWSPPANLWMFWGDGRSGSHKMLKSVVRSFVESFTSHSTYYAGDVAMGHIVEAAWSSGATGFRFDLVSGRHDGSPLLVPVVGHSVAQYAAWLPHLITNSKSSIRFVSRAELVVTIDPAMRRPCAHGDGYESPFSCLLRIVDDRGREYSHWVHGWSGPRRQKPAGRRRTKR